MTVPAVPSRLEQQSVLRVGSGAPLGADQAGGKGASLDRLTRLGWPVPAAIVVTADAFRSQLAAVGRSAPVGSLLGALPDGAAREALVAAFEATPTIVPIRTALDAGLRDLVASTASAVANAHPPSWAVRSSAVDEDGAVASFAGLHDTELGLTAADVEPAIRRCWASIWSAPAVAYRARRGLPLDTPAMAVVVQQLVAADVSAIVFTRHPVSGREDQVLVTAIRGLGEPMVSGAATPDTVVVDKASRTIVDRVAGAAGPGQFVEAGRIVEVFDPRADPALDDDVLVELVDIALAVEASAGCAVDIEAARSGSTWLLLQSRPITTR